jgi:AraC family transcriptional activator FtrA
LLGALRAAHARGCRVISICGGAFVLAQAGLLAQRRATTHWRHVASLAAAYPDIRVEPHALYVDDGDLLTSAGSAAGLDLCIHVVRKDFGSRAANSVARRLVVAAHRDGGQSQFIERSLPPPSGARLSSLLDRVRGRLDEPWPIRRLASEAHVSVRSLQRHVHQATGVAPGEWLLHARLARARELLEETTLPIEMIAGRSGLGTGANLRQHFKVQHGVSPATYRVRFAAAAR